MLQDEARLLSCCYADPAFIDKAIAAGLSPDHYQDHRYREQWRLMAEMRCTGEATDASAVYAYAHRSGRLEKAGGLPGISEASSTEAGPGYNASAFLSLALARHAQRQSWRLLQQAKELVEQDGADLTEVSALAEEVVGVCGLKVVTHRKTSDIAAEAEADALAAINGTADLHPVITTGLEKFDKWATPIQRHEYVVVAGRSSHGKSSLLLQIAGHNLARGMKVAVLSLETSDKSVIKQLAAQRARINLRMLPDEMRERQDKYMKALAYLKASKNLLVFDRDIQLADIQNRCRLLAQSFKPDLVIIDYLGLISGTEGSSYERASMASKSMVEIKKQLGCTLMLGCQLNQASEKEEREPNRTDFRDSGQILEDAHRVISVWRKPQQRLDQTVFACELLQLKNRDGPLTKVNCSFHAGHTVFTEE